MSERPDGYPVRWEADVVLRDGSVAQVRPIVPDDAQALKDFHAAQSAESIYLRFFAPMKELSDKDAKRFTHVDYQQRVALVMFASEKLIGVARYDRLDGPTGASAEVAFNVSDHFHGRGVGSVLLEHLADIGREAGVQEFTADVLPQNRKMMRVFIDAGFNVKHHFDDGVIALSFPIEPTAASEQVRIAREQRAESVSVRAVLQPESVAVIGVSRRRESTGRDVLEHVRASGFTGPVHAVNRNPHDDIEGVTVHAEIGEVDGPVDLALVAVPAEQVHDAVLACAAKGVKAVVVYSSGFAESGPEGEKLQRELLRTARTHGMRVVGPNSFGLMNTAENTRLNASLAPDLADAGWLGLFSQSGALAAAGLTSAQNRNLGFSTFVSAGNRIDLSGNDLMQYWLDDDETRVVGLYLESMGNPRKFNRIARRLSMKKPVIVVKSGVSAFGVPPGHRVRPTRIQPDAFRAMLRQAGVLRVENVHQMFDLAQLMVHQPVPAGARVAIVGNSDAFGALAADSAISWGMSVTHGPVNLPGDVTPQDYVDAVRAALEDPEVDSVVTAYLPPRESAGEEIARLLGEVSAQFDKTCVSTFLGIRGLSERLAGPPVDDGPRRIVPSYAMPEDAVRALAGATAYGRWRGEQSEQLVMPEGVDHDAAAKIVDEVLADAPNGRELTQDERVRLLAAYGIELWKAHAVESPDDAAQVAERIGFPVVLKSTSPLARLQPLNSVRADLWTADAVVDAFETLAPRLKPLGADDFVVQKMADHGVPCVVRSVEDELFGPVVRFSLGGVPTEIMNDFGYRIPPFTQGDADALVDSVAASPLLDGEGPRAAVDRAALRDVVERVALMANDHPELYELELNPINTHAGGAEVLGARITVKPPAGRSDSGRRSLSTF